MRSGCNNRKAWLYVSTILAWLAICSAAQADTGNIDVVISSRDGRPLAGVSVIVTSRDGDVLQATTDEEGRAPVNELEPGLYQVTASLKGYLNVVEPRLRVVRNKTVSFRLRMRTSDESMEEVVVTATAIRANPYGPVSTSYKDRELLRTAAGSGSDVLRALDGLPALKSNGEFASFTVRGRGPRDNLILVDGIPYEQAVHFDESLGEQEDINGGGRYSIFPPTIIEGASFSPGGWSAAYSGRNGSKLELDVARGNPSPTASFRIDIAGYEAIYDGPSGFDDDTSLLFTARHLDFGEFFDTIDEKDIGDPVLTDVILKTTTDLNPNNQLEFLVLYTPESFERDVENVLESDNLEDRQLLDNEQDSDLVGVTWTRLFGDDGRWENRFYFRNTDKTSREGEAFPDSDPMVLPPDQVPVREDILTIDEEETEIGWRSDLSATNRWGLFSTGLRVTELDLDFETIVEDDWIRYQYDTDDFRPDPTQNYIVLTPADTNSAFSRTETQYAAYAEQVFVSGQWDFRAGVRYDYDGFSDESYISPRFGANYRISPETRLSLSAGTFYQSPRFLDRAADPMNFGLENEKTNHFSVGVHHKFNQNWDVLVEAYYQDLDDLVTDPDAVTGQATNNGDGTSYGLDVVVNRQFENGWTGNAVYSYNDAELDDNDGMGDYDAPFSHEHYFTIGASWEFSERWLFAFRAKYATGRPRDDYIIHSDVLSDIGGPLRFSQEFVSTNTDNWDDFYQLNARVDYRRPVGPVDFIAFLDVLNLYGSSEREEWDFNSATGELIDDDEEATPFIGIRFEKAWK